MRTLRWMALALIGLGASACETMSPSDAGNLVPKTVVEDASLPAIDMNGSRFHLETFGTPTDPVIVFLHGGPGGDYRGMLRLKDSYNGKSLASDYYLVFWDQRGSGLSKRHDKGVLTIDTFVNDLDTVVDLYSGGRPVYLIGESWGGMFATKYINTHPEKVAGAVLIEPGPLTGATAERIKDDMYDLNLTSEWLNDYAWNSQFVSPDDHARMDYQRMLGARDAQPKFHLSESDPQPCWRQGSWANRYIQEDGQDDNGKFNYDFTTHLDAFATPVLFICGSMSEVLGESLQTEQVTVYPSASFVVVEGAGHDVAWVKTADVLAHIWTYLDAREGGVQ